MITLIITFGLISRLLFSFLPAFTIDFGVWIAWGERLVSVGPANFYSQDVWTNYMPAYLYVLWFVGGIRNLTQIPLDSKLYEVILKLPANLADIGIAVLIFAILQKRIKQKIAFGASIFYLFNPALIFNSSVWGQIDSVFTFFLLVATYFLIEVKKPVFASLALSLSFLIKPHAVAFLPIFAAYLFWRFGLKSLVKSIIASAVLVFLLSLPFFITDPILGLPQMFLQMSADYPHTSLFAYNFWWLIGGWKPDYVTNFFISNQVWGIILWIVSQIIILFYLAKNRGRENFYLAAALTLLAFFILPTRVHERYLFPFFAFGTLTAGFFGRFFWLVYASLTLIHFFNLYFVYTYYNPNFLKIESVSQFIGNFSIVLAVITVAIFSLILSLLFTKRYQPINSSLRREARLD